VFAYFDPGASDLRTYLAGAADANWKLYVENSLDGYHVLPLHITYFEYLEQTEGSRPTLGDMSESYDLGNGHAVVKYRGPWARPVARWTPALGAQNRARVEAAYAELVRKHGPERAELIGRTDRVLLIFPNLIILDLMGVVVRTITPTSAGHTQVTQWLLAAAGADPDLQAQQLDSSTPSRARRVSGRWMISRPSRPARPGFAPAPVSWSDMSRGMSREHRGQPSLSNDELTLRTFWRQWQQRMRAG
jgi:p-cumate 2,3-dioxygenase alpha subunit